jgi:hypothetical protein
MPYSNIRKVNDVTIGDWVHEGEWIEDTRYDDITYAVTAHTDDGIWVHENAFMNDEAGAKRLAARVEARGVICLKHWGFHEFFSLTLEQRLNEESYHEDMHRKGFGHLSNGVFSGGHA